jgi:ketosteroid isomerase-like protein
MTSADPMATAIDWLDAYRARDLAQLVGLYAEEATLFCDDRKVVGREAIAAYWSGRFDSKPAGELEDLRHAGDDVLISYRLPDGIGHTTLSVDDAGRIARCRCEMGSCLTGQAA